MKHSIEITYPHLNGLPVATIILKRNIDIVNEPIPILIVDKLYSSKNVTPQNKRDITVTIDAGKTKMDMLRVSVTPNYSLDGLHFQYIKGVKTDHWHGEKETDDRVENIVKEYTNSLTKVYKLATEEELENLKPLVEEAIQKLDEAKRK